MRFTSVLLCALLQLNTVKCWSQSSSWQPSAAAGKAHERKENHRQLALVDTIRLKSEAAGSYVSPLECDTDGNLYLKVYSDVMSGIRKLNPQGERVAVFLPETATPDVKVDFGHNFSIGADGDLYQVTYAKDEVTRYVFVYRPDGSFKSKIKLQPGFAWNVSLVAPFASGNMLVAGLKYDKNPENYVMWPFTGIFSSDGTLLKQVKLKDDDKLHDMAASGDRRVTSPGALGTNAAVGRGAMEPGPDGNIYLMRRLSPAIFYVISPGGEILRRFSVDPGRSDYMPLDMHIAGNRIAVQFLQGPELASAVTIKQLIKVVDLAGREIATYDDPKLAGDEQLGSAFICYSDNPERFTYLNVMEKEGGRVGLRILEPR